MPRRDSRLDFHGPGEQPVGDCYYVAWHAARRHAHVPPHQAASTKLVLVVAGQLDLLVDGRPLRLVGERWALLARDSLLAGHGQAVGRFCWIGIHTDTPPGAGPRLLDEDAIRSIHQAIAIEARIAPAALVDTAERLVEAHQQEASALVRTARTALLFDALLEAIRTPTTMEEHPADAAVDALLTAMRRDPAADHAVDAYASAHDCSRDACFRAFRRRVGFTPHQYLLWIRTQGAVDALRGGASQREAAHRFGFANTTVLGRAVRKFYDTTPGRLVCEGP